MERQASASVSEAIRAGVRQMEVSNGVGQEDPVKTAEDAARLAAIQVHVCHICQGSGLKREIYGYRVMETICGSCHGKGTFVKKNGKPLADPLRSPKPSFKKAAYAQGSAERIATLRRDIASIDARIAPYAAELATLRAQLPAGAGGAAADDQQAALLELVRQVERMVDRLKAERCAREARLQRYLQPERVEEAAEDDAGGPSGRGSERGSASGGAAAGPGEAQGAAGAGVIGSGAAVPASVPAGAVGDGEDAEEIPPLVAPSVEPSGEFAA